MKWLVKLYIILALALLAVSCSPAESVTEEITTHTPLPTAAPLIRPAPVETAPPNTVAGFSYYLDERLPQDAREVVLNNRSRLFVDIDPDITENPGKYIALDYDEEVDDRLVEILENPGFLRMEGGKFTYETVEEELDFLMDYLKYAYGAYQYYGGDEVFLPLKEEILTALKNKNSDGVYLSDYTYILGQKLEETIIDCHFAVGDKFFHNTQGHKYFMQNADYGFNKESNGFYTEIEGKKYELIAVDNSAPSDVLVPYLNPDGFIVWIVGYPDVTSKENTCAMVLYHEESGEILETAIPLSPVVPTKSFDSPMYNEHDLKGIRVVESRRCTPTDDEPDMYEVMSEAAEKLQNQEIIIVDLRDNEGGSTSYATVWLSSLLDKDIKITQGVFFSHHTKTTYLTHGAKWGHSYEKFMETGIYESWASTYMSLAEPVENKDKLFIVLADINTASAGEDFVDILRQTENTIVIGTNTAGAFATGNVVSIPLPYSKISLRCGYNLHLEPDLTTIEGIGILPDIWCPPDESLDRAMKFIEVNGLK